MSLSIIFSYQSTDSTAYLNSRLEHLIEKGIYWGGLLSYTPGSSTATRAPILAVGYDGVTVADDENASKTFTQAGTWQWVIKAKYNPLGTPATPTIDESFMSTAEYNADPDINYLIRVGAVVCTSGGVISNVYYTQRDVVDPVGRSNIRGVVATTADLPVPAAPINNHNRPSDCYFVTAEEGWYYWTGAAWSQARAAGAASRDAAYDDAGAAGSGRSATVDAQAILDIQSPTAHRQMDIANAVRRIDKTAGILTGGDCGEDTKLAGDTDFGGLLIRTRFTSGANLQVNEPVTISGTTPPSLTFTRPSNMSAAIGNQFHLVEVTGTSNNQDGVYIFRRTGVAGGTIHNLDGTNPVGVLDSGTANAYTIRQKIGSNVGSGGIGAAGTTVAGRVYYEGDNAAALSIGNLELINVGNIHFNRIVADVTDSNLLSAPALSEIVLATGEVSMSLAQLAATHTLAAVPSVAAIATNATGRGVIAGTNANPGGAFSYSTAADGHDGQITKWIIPQLGGGQGTVGGNWAYQVGAENYWKGSTALTALDFEIDDWPEGMTLNWITVDWKSASIPNKLQLDAYRYVWNNGDFTTDIASAAQTRLVLGATLNYTNAGLGRRTQSFNANANNTMWKHATDMLVIRIVSVDNTVKEIYRIRLNVSYRSVNKWDGLDYV